MNFNNSINRMLGRGISISRMPRVDVRSKNNESNEWRKLGNSNDHAYTSGHVAWNDFGSMGEVWLKGNRVIYLSDPDGMWSHEMNYPEKYNVFITDLVKSYGTGSPGKIIEKKNFNNKNDALKYVKYLIEKY